MSEEGIHDKKTEKDGVVQTQELKRFQFKRTWESRYAY